MRRRLRTFIVVAVVLPLIVSDVVWAFALGALADDSHHVALRSFPGEVDLVLQHGARHSADDHDHDHHARGDRESDVSSLHADDAYPGSHHRDHVVHLGAAIFAHDRIDRRIHGCDIPATADGYQLPSGGPARRS